MLSDLGNVEFYKENHHAARKYLKKGLIIHKKIGSEYFRGCDLHDIGLTYWKTQDLIHADQYVSEAMEVFQTLKTPRELLMNTVSVMGLKRAQGKFTEALDVYKKVIQIVNRERIFDIHPAVESGFFRVYSTVGNRDELRNLLKRLVLSNRNETEPYRSNEICRIVGLQLIAEGRYRAADKILSHNAKFDGQSYVVDVPLEYQLFILRIHYDPSTDHSDILSNDLFRFMKKLTYLRFEASWLKKLKMYYKNRTKIERESGKVFLKELSGYDNILGRYWMICSLEYFARMNNDNQMIFKARKEREMLLRDMTEGFTPEEKKRFLSRPVLTRI